MPDAPEAEQATTEAQRLLELAAGHAVAVGAPRNAITLFDRLLDLVPPDDILLRVTLRRAEIARQLAIGLEASVPRLTTAIDLAERLGRQDDLLALRLARSNVDIAAGRAGRARETLIDIQRECIGRPHRVHILAECTRALCLCAQGLGDPKLAREATAVGLDDIERYGDDADFAIYLTSMSMHYGLAGYRRLSTLVRRAVVPLLGERDPKSTAALLNLAATLGNDRPLDAWAAVVESNRRQRSLGLSSVAQAAQVVMVAPLVGTPEALSLARDVIDRARSDGQSALHDWEAYLAAGSAVVAWRLGEPDLVLPAVDEAEGSSDPVADAWWFMREAVVTAFDGDEDRAGTLAETAVNRMANLGLAHEDMPMAFALAVELLTSFGMYGPLRALTEMLETLSMGQRYAVLSGLLFQSHAALDDDVSAARAAVDAFDTAGAALPAALARVDLAQRLLSRGNGVAADVELALAEQVVTAIDATPAVERIAAMRAASRGCWPTDTPGPTLGR